MRQAAPVVPDLQEEVVADAPRSDDDAASAREGGDAMTDGIFENRVPQQRRYRGVESVRRNVPHDLEAILEAYLFDLHIHAQEIDLLAERHDLVACMIQREAQQPAQTRDHLVRR